MENRKLSLMTHIELTSRINSLRTLHQTNPTTSSSHKLRFILTWHCTNTFISQSKKEHEEFVAHDYAINRDSLRECRPNNMNLNLNSLHAHLKCFNIVANELVFILFYFFLYPRKKNKIKRSKLDSVRPKKARVALDIQREWEREKDSLHKIKFHDEVRWVNYSSFRLINKHPNMEEKMLKNRHSNCVTYFLFRCSDILTYAFLFWFFLK